MSLGQTIEFLRMFHNKPNIMMDVNRRASRVRCYLLFLPFLRRREATRVPRRHSITSRTWCHGLSLVWNSAHTRWEHFCIIFFDFSGVQAEFYSRLLGKKSDDFWCSLRSSRSSQSSENVSIWSLQNLHDRADCPDRSQLHPFDRGRLNRPGRLRSSG